MACPISNSCLGMCEWTGCPGTRAVESIATSSSTASNYATEPTRPSPSHTPIPAPAGSSSTCFATFVNDEQLAVLSKGVTPVNTDKNTRWAVSNFEAWKEARNQKHLDDPIPEDLLMSNDPVILNLHLSRFVLETRKSNGEYYPPKTLHQLLCGILRHTYEEH